MCQVDEFKRKSTDLYDRKFSLSNVCKFYYFFILALGKFF